MPAETHDIVLSSPFPNYDFCAHKLRELWGQMGLSFFPVDEGWVKEFTQKLQAREIIVRVLLDLTANESVENGPSLVLARDSKRQRGTVLDDPDRAATMAPKAKFHQMLVENHIPVPNTLTMSRNLGAG